MPIISKSGTYIANFNNIPSVDQITGVGVRFEKLDEPLNEGTNLARIGTWEIDILKRTIYWSDITRVIHEVDPGFIPDLKEAINFFKTGKNRTIIEKKIDNAFKNCTSFDVELQIVSAKNNLKWIRVIAETESLNGFCIRVYGTIQDINAQKNAEIESTRALEERNTILESIDDAFFAVDKNWVVTYWNHMAEKVLGKPKDEVLNRNLWEIYADSINSVSYKKYHQAIREKKVVRFEDYYSPLAKWYEISAFPSDNGLSVYFKDITERLNYIKAIEEQNENLKQISWLQSHMVRGPLARIMGLINLIGDPNQGVLEKKKMYEYLLLSANELDEVIKTIIDKAHKQITSDKSD